MDTDKLLLIAKRDEYIKLALDLNDFYINSHDLWSEEEEKALNTVTKLIMKEAEKINNLIKNQ